MKTLAVVCLNLLLFQFCFGQEDKFYDTVLDDFRRLGAFVVLDISSDKYKGRAIITNKDLYHYLSETKGFDKAAYKNFVKSLLVNNEILELQDFSLSEAGYSLQNSKENRFTYFELVKDSNEINEIAAKGKDEFIKHFFHKPKERFVIKRGIKDWKPIIDKLFQWNIAVYTDDETGYLIISNY